MKDRIINEISQNHHVTMNLIQGLSMLINTINIERLRVKPAMTERFPSIGEMENISCAKRTEKNLLPYSPISLLPSKRVAFTLAEVLITLGIIGVVAALTLPSVIEKHQKQVTVTKLKYLYSVMSQALVMSQAQDGENWDLGTTYDKDNTKRVVQEHILPYIQYADEGFYNNKYYIQLKNGIFIRFMLDGNQLGGESPSVMRMIVDLQNNRKNATSNGWAGAPDHNLNFSRYNFVLNFNFKKNKLEFLNFGGDTTREGIMNNTVYKCNKDNPPYLRENCGALIFFDGWQIKDDYPW